ncbi:MAG: hypothetical protein LAP85_19415 [Acidobacteriia bacterium]|nr:hypothetical protein [Terriglobia bacterium]
MDRKKRRDNQHEDNSPEGAVGISFPDSFDPLPYEWLIENAKWIKTAEEFSKLYLYAREQRGIRAIYRMEDLFQIIKIFEPVEIEIAETEAWKPDKHRADPKEVIYPVRSYFDDCWCHPVLMTLLLVGMLEAQFLIPDLQLFDILPISRLTLDRLRLYQEMQIFRGIPRPIAARYVFRHVVGSYEGIQTPPDAWRLTAARRLVARIPLKLENPEASAAFRRMMAEGELNKAQARQLLLASLYSQRDKEATPAQRRINRTRYLKTADGRKALVAPSALPLIEYWEWLKDKTQQDFAKDVLDLAGWSYNGEDATLIHLEDLRLNCRKEGQKKIEAEPFEDYINPESADDALEGGSGGYRMGFPFIEAVTDTDEKKILAEKIDLLPLQERRYILRLWNTLWNDPGLSFEEARKAAQGPMQINPANERKILSRIRGKSKK